MLNINIVTGCPCTSSLNFGGHIRDIKRVVAAPLTAFATMISLCQQLELCTSLFQSYLWVFLSGVALSGLSCLVLGVDSDGFSEGYWGETRLAIGIPNWMCRLSTIESLLCWFEALLLIGSSLKCWVWWLTTLPFYIRYAFKYLVTTPVTHAIPQISLSY